VGGAADAAVVAAGDDHRHLKCTDDRVSYTVNLMNELLFLRPFKARRDVITCKWSRDQQPTGVSSNRA